MEAIAPMMLICAIGTRRFALALADVIGILPVVPLWKPPGLPRPLLGFAAIGGAAVPVLAPATLLDDAPPVERIGLYAHLVQVRGAGDGSICLLVDRAAEILSIAAADVRPVDPALSQRGCVTGEVDLDDGVAHVLALGRLLADGERARIAALAADAGRRADEWAA